MENKYFVELARRLNKDRINTGTPDSGKLPILLDGREIGIVVPGGGLRVPDLQERLEQDQTQNLKLDM